MKTQTMGIRADFLKSFDSCQLRGQRGKVIAVETHQSKKNAVRVFFLENQVPLPYWLDLPNDEMVELIYES